MSLIHNNREHVYIGLFFTCIYTPPTALLKMKCSGTPLVWTEFQNTLAGVSVKGVSRYTRYDGNSRH